MRLPQLASIATILALLGAGTSAAGAQGTAADLFVPPSAILAPPSIASIAEGFNLSASPLPTATFRRNEAMAAAESAAETVAEQAMLREMAQDLDRHPASPPLPPVPVREASLKPVALPKPADEGSKAEATRRGFTQASRLGGPGSGRRGQGAAFVEPRNRRPGQCLLHRDHHLGGGFHASGRGWTPAGRDALSPASR